MEPEGFVEKFEQSSEKNNFIKSTFFILYRLSNIITTIVIPI